MPLIDGEKDTAYLSSEGVYYFDHDDYRHMVPAHMVSDEPLAEGDRLMFGGCAYRVSHVVEKNPDERYNEVLVIQKYTVHQSVYRWQDISQDWGVGVFSSEPLGLEKALKAFTELEYKVSQEKGTTLFRLVRRRTQEATVHGVLSREA